MLLKALHLMEVHDTKTFRVIKGAGKHPVGVVRHNDGSATVSYVAPATLGLGGEKRHVISGEWQPEGSPAALPAGKHKLVKITGAEKELGTHHLGGRDLWMSRRLGHTAKEVYADAPKPSDAEAADIELAKQYAKEHPAPMHLEPEPEEKPAPIQLPHPTPQVKQQV